MFVQSFLCGADQRDILTVCHRIFSYLLWYSTVVSVGRSVRSYVCAYLLSTHEGSPSKGGCICTPLTPPLDPPLLADSYTDRRKKEESQKIDDLPILATRRSGTSAMLYSKVNSPVAHGSTR